jgi:hypothetical protein
MTWDRRPFAIPPKDKPKKWTLMLGDRKFATVKGEVWWTKDLVQAVKQSAMVPDSKVITEDEFHAAKKALLASQIHKRLPGMTMRCGIAPIPGMLCTDTEGEVTCPKCKEG